MIIDIHTHTYPASDDSLLSPDELIEEARGAGLDGVCLTDHDRFWSHAEVERMSIAHGFPVFHGAEVTTEGGHLLVFGLDAFIFGMHSGSFVKRLAGEAGGFVAVAHPYRRAYRDDGASATRDYDVVVERVSGKEVFAAAHGVEVLNGRGTDAENAFSMDIATRLGLRGTGGSDAHMQQDLGTCATEFERTVRSVDELIQELRAGRFRPIALNGLKGRGKQRGDEVRAI